MAGRRTNLALFALLAIAFATGGLAYALGTGWARWAVIGHGIVAFAMLALAPWKSAIARRGLERARSGSWASLAFSILLAAAIVLGIGHSTGLIRSVAGTTSLNVHVGAALLSIPLAIWHVVARRVRPRRADLSRRALVRAGVLTAGAGALYGVTEGVVRAASLTGARRRFTGSHERGTGRPGSMPVTQWLDDNVPLIDEAAWRLVIRAPGFERAWTYEELSKHHDTLRATLDCTGGWYAVQDWEGAYLSRLLPDAGGAQSIRVRSVTGYSRRVPVSLAPRLLIATRVGGKSLSSGHGYPARLVAPGRRGFWWVKWIDSIELSRRPSWWQSPFPLT
jgi:DMSO/TMAO reductase YedYZ molybdopterin-dependent catalytic subunit